MKNLNSKKFKVNGSWELAATNIVKIYNEFAKDHSKCNLILLISERNFFYEFYKYLKSEFPKDDILFFNVISGYALKKNGKEIKQRTLFLKDELSWLIDHRTKKYSIKLIKELFQAAKESGKLLILCGYSYHMPKFKEILSLIYFRGKLPEIREIELKTPGL